MSMGETLIKQILFIYLGLFLIVGCGKKDQPSVSPVLPKEETIEEINQRVDEENIDLGMPPDGSPTRDQETQPAKTHFDQLADFAKIALLQLDMNSVAAYEDRLYRIYQIHREKLSEVYLKYLEVLDDKMVWSEDRVFRVKSFYSEAFIRHQNSIFKLFLEKIVQYNGFTTFGQCGVDGVKKYELEIDSLKKEASQSKDESRLDKRIAFRKSFECAQYPEAANLYEFYYKSYDPNEYPFDGAVIKKRVDIAVWFIESLDGLFGFVKKDEVLPETVPQDIRVQAIRKANLYRAQRFALGIEPPAEVVGEHYEKSDILIKADAYLYMFKKSPKEIKDFYWALDYANYLDCSQPIQKFIFSYVCGPVNYTRMY